MIFLIFEKPGLFLLDLFRFFFTLNLDALSELKILLSKKKEPKIFSGSCGMQHFPAAVWMSIDPSAGHSSLHIFIIGDGKRNLNGSSIFFSDYAFFYTVFQMARRQ
ncbi:MAG TPA: hypothetical protein DCZ74_00205 [Treponema sp.]|nr:hypothetical protein [Treponema sp.]